MVTNTPPSAQSDDERQDAWEATFFSPDGSAVKHTASGDAPPPAPKAAAKPKSTAPSVRRPTDLDDDPALAQRLASQAAETVHEHVEELGEVLHEKFVGLLMDKVREKDGQLTADDVAEMGQEFRAHMEDIEKVFLDAVETYTLAREKTRVDQSRGNLFHRLMVKKFEHRFADEQTLQTQPELLSRRMLPGYLNMVLVMFGTERLANYEARTRKLIDKLRRDAGGRLDWADVYRSPEARKIILLAEVDIARRFDDIDKRLEWMIAVVNSNLIPAEENLAGTPWVFNRRAAEWMLTSLLNDLAPTLKDQKTRRKIADRIGDDGIDILDSVAARFS